MTVTDIKIYINKLFFTFIKKCLYILKTFIVHVYSSSEKQWKTCIVKL